MKVLNLNHCFPEPTNPNYARGPLPKQGEFLRASMDLSPTAPKFIRYVGGLGSGKTIIGSVTVLCWALQYPGDYLIGRLFSPELKLTTYKTFLEICPPELIVEHRVADAVVKIRSASGKISNIIFRGLDEPEKLKSLNLNGFYIDEATQVSEEAFLLLQGRLRGSHVRKGILTTNSAGRSWSWRYFVDKSMFKNDFIKNQFLNISAPSTENYHLPDGYVQSMLDSWSEDRIKREIMADEDSFVGQVYSEFRRDIHVVKPFRIPEHWERHIRLDHGLRNPACALFFAIGNDGEVYLYKEFYESEWLINEIVNGKKVHAQYQPGIAALGKHEQFVSCKIDPSTKIRTGKDGTSSYDEYYRHWPKTWPMLGFAKNDVTLGIDRVKSYLKVNPTTGKPLLYIFDTCTNTLDEIATYKYPELKPMQVDRKAEHEKPVKVHDHAMDALRYMIADLPDPSKPEEVKTKTKYQTLERSLVNELKAIHNPPQRDPFGDI